MSKRARNSLSMAIQLSFCASLLFGAWGSLPILAEPLPIYLENMLGPFVFSPDGSKLAIGLYLEDPLKDTTDSDIEVYDTRSGQQIAHLWHTDTLVGIPPGDLDFSPDGSRLAATWYVHEDVSGARGGTEVWDLTSGKSLPLVASCAEPGHTVVFLDDRQIMIGSGSQHSWTNDSRHSRLCDVESGLLLASFPNIRQLYALPELNLLMGVGYTAKPVVDRLVYNRFARLFDNRTYQQVANFPHLEGVISLNQKQGTAIFYTDMADPSLVLLDLKQRKILKHEVSPSESETLPEYVSLIPLVGERQLKITGGAIRSDSSQLELFDSKSAQRLFSRKVPGRLMRRQLSKDQSQLALLSCAAEPDLRCEFGLWRLSDLKLLRSWPLNLEASARQSVVK